VLRGRKGPELGQKRIGSEWARRPTLEQPGFRDPRCAHLCPAHRQQRRNQVVAPVVWVGDMCLYLLSLGGNERSPDERLEGGKLGRSHEQFAGWTSQSASS
jgi:hypothetical protein